MDEKTKVTTLVEMGFTVDEALALAKGNYRTVPDEPKKEEPKEEPKKEEPKEEPKTEEPKKEDPTQVNISKALADLQKEIKNLKEGIISDNINSSNLPPKQGVDDILATIINPVLPEKPKGGN